MKEDILTVFLVDLMFILALVGFAVSLFVFVVNLTSPLTGFTAGFSEGFSMCPASSYGLDYLNLGDAYCAYTPGDVLIMHRHWPPEVNSIACAVHPQYGNVCHLVYESSDSQACFIGLHERAKWTWCFTQDQYLGTVVAKLPRAFGIPGMAFVAMRHAVADFLAKVNAGAYPGFGT